MHEKFKQDRLTKSINFIVSQYPLFQKSQNSAL